MKLRRFFAPLAYATVGAAATAILVMGRVGTVADSNMQEPTSTAVASAEEYNIPRVMRHSDEVTPALIIPGVMPRTAAQEAPGSDYATGYESSTDVHLVNYTY